MDILDNIINVMNQKGISQKQLCEYVGIKQQAFTNWKSGHTKSYKKYIDKIAECLKVSTDYLLGKTDVPTRIEDYFNIVDIPKQGSLPIVGIVSAGKGCFADTDILGYELADAKYCNEDHYWLRVRGDSMAPRIEDGDLVLVRKQSSVDSGNVAICLVDNEEGFIKKVHYGENYIILKSMNPFYSPMEFRGKDMLRVRILGKAIELKSKF